MIGLLASSRLKLKHVNFDLTSYCLMGDQPSLDFELTDAFSVLCRVNFVNTSGLYLAGKIKLFGANDRGWYLQCDNGRPAFFVAASYTGSNSDWLYRRMTSGPSFADGAWHTFVATYDGSKLHAGIKLYVDGAIATSVTDFGGPIVGPTMKNPADFSWAGRLNSSGTHDNIFGYSGRAADLAVYDKELSAGEVATLSSSQWPNLLSTGPFGDLVGYWRPRLSDVVPTITDLSSGAHNATCYGDLASNQARLTSR